MENRHGRFIVLEKRNDVRFEGVHTGFLSERKGRERENFIPCRGADDRKDQLWEKRKKVWCEE